MAPEINLDDLDSEESFADKIGESFEWSDFHEPARRYLPEPCLSELITKESIEIELDRFEDELAVKLRGKFKKTYKQFEQYDSSYRRGLALWIHAVAPKIFAIAVQCELDAFKLVLAMEIFRQNLFTDKKLPVRDPALLVDIFSKKVWSTTQLHSFFDKQWRLLVPVFSPDRYDYDLDSECIFPFKLRRTLHKAGAFSSVYRVKIHKGHQLHEELGDVSTCTSKFTTRTNYCQVALKELKVPQSNEDNGANDEWDREARALRAINKLDHPHVVKCIAAVRRGESRYFMFPWAEGDSLRDFWNKTSMKGPSQEVILQTITQLLGIADALHQLHNYHEGRRRSLPGNSLSLTIPVIGGGPNSTSATYHMDGDQSEDDDLHSQTDDSIRHGDLKPENILRFTESDAGLGTLKIADMGLAKQHVLATSDRNDKRQITSTRYGTQPYEAPETITAKYGRSRLYDVWSMGCITLEFIIWILYGNERLTNFYNQIAGGPQLPYQYYEIPDPNEPSHAEVHRVVLKWIEHIETNDPECSQDSAIRDLLAIVREKLLVVRLPPTSVSSRSGGRTLAPPALGGASQFRATAEEFRE
jgi:serine/threonine protein kinase